MNRLKKYLSASILFVLIGSLVFLIAYRHAPPPFLNGQVSKEQLDLEYYAFFVFLGFMGGIAVNKMLSKNKTLNPVDKRIGIEESSPKREQQLQMILAVCDALGYQPLEIPTGGKAKIREICLNRARVFTDSSFSHAWKDGTTQALFRLLESDKFSSKN